MAYKKTTWVDNQTPLNAVNMNNIENGIEEAINTANKANNNTIDGSDAKATTDLINPLADTEFQYEIEDIEELKQVLENDIFLRLVGAEIPSVLITLVNRRILEDSELRIYWGKTNPLVVYDFDINNELVKFRNNGSDFMFSVGENRIVNVLDAIYSDLGGENKKKNVKKYVYVKDFSNYPPKDIEVNVIKRYLENHKLYICRSRNSITNNSRSRTHYYKKGILSKYEIPFKLDGRYLIKDIINYIFDIDNKNFILNEKYFIKKRGVGKEFYFESSEGQSTPECYMIFSPTSNYTVDGLIEYLRVDDNYLSIIKKNRHNILSIKCVHDYELSYKNNADETPLLSKGVMSDVYCKLVIVVGLFNAQDPNSACLGVKVNTACLK